MMTYIPRLDEAGVTAAAIATHKQWGGERSVESYVMRALSATHGGQDHVSYAGLFERSELISTLARYRFELCSPKGQLPAIGIGAVFTAAPYRGHGHARELLRRVMADAQNAGSEATLLFSDIEPAFYEKIGFTTLSHVTWSARSAALPSRPVRLEPLGDEERVLDIFERSWTTEWLRMQRTPERFRDCLWRHRGGETFLIGDDDYVSTRLLGDGTLWVDDAATTTIRAPDLWASLRALADGSGAARVSGWLRPEHAGGPFVAVQRRRCIPMIATAAHIADARSHFASLDRF